MTRTEVTLVDWLAFRFPAEHDGKLSALVHKDNANGALEAMEAAWSEKFNKRARQHRDLIYALRNIFDGKAIEWDANGWAEVTMHEDEVRSIQEAIHVR